MESAVAAAATLLDGVQHRVGGSSMVRLLGGQVEPRDVDVMVSAADRSAVLEAVGGAVVDKRFIDDGGPVASSWIIDVELAGASVEILGDLAIRSNGVTWQLPMRPGPVMNLEGVSVPLAAPGPWVALYTLYRPQTAAMLAELVTDDERVTTISELPPSLGIQWP